MRTMPGSFWAPVALRVLRPGECATQPGRVRGRGASGTC
jgi:hypothetical protein